MLTRSFFITRKREYAPLPQHQDASHVVVQPSAPSRKHDRDVRARRLFLLTVALLSPILFTTFCFLSPTLRRLSSLLASYILSWLVPVSPSWHPTSYGSPTSNDVFLVGVGKADITGPITEINLMGYANTSQLGTGLRQRLYARAFIVADPDSDAPEDRWCYLVLDTQSGDTAVRYGILSTLERVEVGARNGPRKLLSDFYGKNNVAVTGTHSHSGPGGWLNYLLPQVTSRGFSHQSWEAIVNGSVLAIQRAHESLQKGHLDVVKERVWPPAGINRSWYSYLANPEAERRAWNVTYQRRHAESGENKGPREGSENAQWRGVNGGLEDEEKVEFFGDPYDGSIDHTMTVLRFSSQSGSELGVLTWYATHGTSVMGNNTLISGDNKGVAAWLTEQAFRSHHFSREIPVPDPPLPPSFSPSPGGMKTDFVAGFSQSAVGDISPNILGAFCEDTGLPCHPENSTCSDGRSTLCRARGPNWQSNPVDAGTASAFEIGRRQYAAAMAALAKMRKCDRLRAAQTEDIAPRLPGAEGGEGVEAGDVNGENICVGITHLTGTSPGRKIRSAHTFTSLSNFTFPLPNGTHVRTCPAALGAGFAGGTSDGPGAFDFTQGAYETRNPFWRAVASMIKTPSRDQVSCQGEKGVLLDIGEMERPYAWGPNVVDSQMLRVGDLVVVVSAGEVSTMAGRRWREEVGRVVSEMSLSEAQIEEAENGGRRKGGARKGKKPIVVLGGPANTYVHYITTEEEYSIQRYEGASTLHGPHTLAAHIHLTKALLPKLSLAAPFSQLPKSQLIDEVGEPYPPDNTNASLSFISPIIVDSPGPPAPYPPFHQRHFGDVLKDVDPLYTIGVPVSAIFVGANPRNDVRLEGTFAAVEELVYKHVGSGSDGKEIEVWRTVRDDSDWGLVLNWRRKSTVLGTSEVEIVWETAERGREVRPGIYRIRWRGDAKSLGGGIEEVGGTSSTFKLLSGA